MFALSTTRLNPPMWRRHAFSAGDVTTTSRSDVEGFCLGHGLRTDRNAHEVGGPLASGEARGAVAKIALVIECLRALLKEARQAVTGRRPGGCRTARHRHEHVERSMDSKDDQQVHSRFRSLGRDSSIAVIGGSLTGPALS